jgi:Ca2+-transporting ATPase
VLTGRARIRVTYTGAETRYGDIVRSLQAQRHERTPLQQAIGSLVRTLIVAAVAICVALAATRIYQGHGIVDAVVSAVTLAVAALPEEFPVVFALFLGVGVYRLARQQALVKRAVVVENIGRVTCICSDKTGTLTEGRLRLVHVVPAEGIDEARLLAAAATASRAGSGDPLDVAIAEAAPRAAGTVLATFPFTEARRREVAVVRTPSRALLCAAKGAPETILSMTCMASERRAAWLTTTRDFAVAGHKVIACCERTLAAEAPLESEPDDDYTFLGLLAFEDPVRDGAAAAVAAAQRAGIRVLMLTGDHPATSQAVAEQLGLGSGAPRVIEGDDLGVLLERGGAAVSGVDVVARAMPAQKLALVEALQRAGEIVAVTGDGVNDAPALQRADIGIAMGERGTRTARDVAAIVLLDDNFRTIVRAIAEGRQLLRNLQLSFAYLLMIHIPLVLTAALIPFAGFPLLYLPAHIVWLELVIHPTAVLAFQRAAGPADLQVLNRTTHTRFFDGRDWLVVGAVGALLTLSLVDGYARGLGVLQAVEHARSTALATLLAASAAIACGLTGLRSRVAWWLGAGAVISALVLIQVEPIARLLHLSPLHADDWLVATGSGLAAGALSALLAYRGRLGIRERSSASATSAA